MPENHGRSAAPDGGSLALGTSPPPASASLFASTAAALLAILASLSPADGQEVGPRCGGNGRGTPFPAPLASPLEPHTRVAPVRVSRGDRQRWVALVDLGERIPFWIARPCPRSTASSVGPQLAGAVAAGAFSRFDLEGHGNEFIEAHFRVGFRLRGRLRGIEGRLEAYHVSSHLGDEFLERTGRSAVSTSREGLELLVQPPVAGGLRLYGGPGVLVRSTRDLETVSFRGGLEWRGSTLRWGPFVPFVSAEAFSWDELDWDPLLAAEAGVSFGGGRFRLALTAGGGPSRAEQFFREADETLWGLSFSVSR